ncbi:hypothetical protein [Undibacterium sp. TS12]|uniref:helix-turn-helix transcriptional regulator n=1 Tax=Undibacterium sp. TS12 TaxID=2908202 RepID=UPI001F4D2126|nr:hypothetical protein [Undibacterium sp. TS12]MCH8622926.1 hypothetical protein [Undibacterium sp. TS12]
MGDIVDRIASGQATLLGIEDICTRLGVARSTFDRWVRNGSGSTAGGHSSLQGLVAGKLFGVSATALDRATNLTEGTISFPPPDIRIGNSPKWEMETFKNWLRANVTAVGSEKK